MKVDLLWKFSSVCVLLVKLIVKRVFPLGTKETEFWDVCGTFCATQSLVRAVVLIWIIFFWRVLFSASNYFCWFLQQVNREEIKTFVSSKDELYGFWVQNCVIFFQSQFCLNYDFDLSSYVLFYFQGLPIFRGIANIIIRSRSDRPSFSTKIDHSVFV